ncbi:hypothetical protein FA13DRAFT_1725158 [Coprinellus micaceus]|uniref:Protein kinase domain-containing protein n=1 Tax=Coprinellus micaceus TaxID=71717 RepID=A0A4Y7TYF0_COPMI|nr:hypothetical protein FA13DRAFT_1725158 [Coprinellus micaceus]
MDVAHPPTNHPPPPTSKLIQRLLNSTAPKTRFLLLLTSPWKKDRAMASDLKSRASENAMPMVPQRIATHVPVTAAQAAQSWRPTGAWKWAVGLGIRGCTNIVNLSNPLKKSARTYFGTGTIGTQELEYICKSWQQNTEMPEFVTEISLFKAQLALLQGVYVPNIIGIYAGLDVVNVLMELPHPAFWMHASDDMPDVLKKRCIDCFERIHAAGVLYGNVQLSHIIVGADARVTLVNFEHAAVLDPLPQFCQKKTTPDKLRLEMRQVKYLLNYDKAREREQQKWIGYKARKDWNEKERVRASRESGYTPQCLAEPDDDVLNPPVDPHRTKGWVDSKYKADRFVVPTITPEFFTSAVEKFIANIRRMEREGDGPPQSPRPPSSTTTSSPVEPTPVPQPITLQVPTEPPRRRSETTLRRSSRKRKAGDDSNFIAGSSKSPLKKKRSAPQVHVEANPDLPAGVRARDFAFEFPGTPPPLPSALKTVLQTFPSPSTVMEPRPLIAKRKRPSEKVLAKRKRVENEEPVPVPVLLTPSLTPKEEDFQSPSKRLRLDELLTPPPSPNGRHVSFAPAPEVHIKRYTIPPEMLTPAKFKYERGSFRRWRSRFKWLPAPERFSISAPLGLRFISRWVTDFLRPLH